MSHLLTVKDTSEYFQITPYQLRQWCKEKRIPHYRIQSRTIRFDKQELENWIESKTVKVRQRIR